MPSPDRAPNVSSLVERDGFAVVRAQLSAKIIDELRALGASLAASSAPQSRQVLYTHEAPTTPRPALGRLMDQWLNVHRRSAPDSSRGAIEALRPAMNSWLGCDGVLFQDVWMEKRSSHDIFPWHQDFPFWPVDRPAGLIVWAPLDPVDAHNGGLHLARNSHLDGCGPPIDLHSGLSQWSDRKIEFSPGDFQIECPALSPGDAVIFHPLTWHMSPPNRSGRRRRAWASSWLHRDTRWAIDRAPRHPIAGVVEDGALVREGGR